MNFIDILISLVLGLIMFGVGLSLRIEHFKNILVYPKAFLVGLSSQMIALPLLAFIFCIVLDIPTEMKIGIMILSVCPGGTTSNFVTYLLNGNTALSVSMTTVNSVITLFSIPFIINLSLQYFMGANNLFSLPYKDTILQIFFITIIPASIGVFINSKLPQTAEKLNTSFILSVMKKSYSFNYIKTITIFLLGIVFTIKLLANKGTGGAGLTAEDFIVLFPIMLIFNMVGLFWGYLFAKICKLKSPTPMTIGIEVGLQNTTLAFLVAGTLLANTEMQKPALVYAFFSFWTAILFGLFIRQKK